MFRRSSLAAALVALVVLTQPGPADAAPISRSNPYRSFNISGVNYGSQRWERARRGRSHGGRPAHGLLFRPR
jgi:hypothetical protein